MKVKVWGKPIRCVCVWKSSKYVMQFCYHHIPSGRTKTASVSGRQAGRRHTVTTTTSAHCTVDASSFYKKRQLGGGGVTVLARARRHRSPFALAFDTAARYASISSLQQQINFPFSIINYIKPGARMNWSRDKAVKKSLLKSRCAEERTSAGEHGGLGINLTHNNWITIPYTTKQIHRAALYPSFCQVFCQMTAFQVFVYLQYIFLTAMIVTKYNSCFSIKKLLIFSLG